MRIWQNTLLYVLLILTVASHVLSYLPLNRVVMDGAGYRWAESWFGQTVASDGLEGDWWVLVVRTLIGAAIVIFGTRFAARGLFAPLLILWLGALFANYGYLAYTAEEPIYFYGDTLGVKLNITLLFPGIFGIGFALALLWAWGESAFKIERHAPGWTMVNTVLFVLWLATLPVAYYLLSTGEPHGETDQYGVLLTISGWFVFFLAMLPYGRARPA